MRFALALLIGLSFAAAASAETITIATFSDPSNDASEPLFNYDANTNVLSGSWSAEGLILEAATGTWDDATFQMSADPGAIPGTVGAGTVEFFSELGDPLMLIEFDSGQLNAIGFGATEFIATNEVIFSGAILPAPTIDESFGFSFANQVALDGAGSFSATASFTSSATLIPEPATVCLLVIGGLAVSRKARRQRA
jgi:hypothetical protein